MEIAEWAEINKLDGNAKYFYKFTNETAAKKFRRKMLVDLACYEEAEFFKRNIDTLFRKFVHHKSSLIEHQAQNPMLRWIDKNLSSKREF